MLDIFNYQFMTRAFIVGGLLSVILPCMGMPILLKRLSSMGDTLAHSSLAGVSIGLFTGIHPILGSIVACIVASLSIEFIRNKLKAYQEISTVIILAASVGIAGIFSSFSSGNTIASYLFGSIITISDSEFYLVIFISLIVLISYKLIYTKLYLLIFDAENANILGINNKTINFIITFLSAISISISAKTIGSLIVSSLLIIPCILAMQFCKTYKNTLIISIIFSICFIYAGLFISYYYDLKPGSVIVLISVITLLMTLIIKRK
ncbi:metal ABC transporter permease [Granulicatella elegans]|uniref:metal ABC transporter permease n=1 Tax=Granulicatella elegans TaxID=137732 RepID=UPI00061D90E8|nr:metal ABC transporter permease [Granulicatella elegans]UEA32016.1 metal ABC transporter permease [Granulicatella elegans]